MFNFVTNRFWYQMSVAMTLCTRCVRHSRKCDSLFEMREFSYKMNVMFVMNCGLLYGCLFRDV